MIKDKYRQFRMIHEAMVFLKASLHVLLLCEHLKYFIYVFVKISHIYKEHLFAIACIIQTHMCKAF